MTASGLNVLAKFETEIVQFKATSFLWNLNYSQISVKGKWLNSKKQVLIDVLRNSFCYLILQWEDNSKTSIIYQGIKISKRYNEQLFNKNAVLKNFAIFTEKHLRWSLFLNKNVDLQSWNFIKKRLQRRFFSCEYCKIFRSTWFGQHLWTASNITRNMEIEKDIFSKTKQNKKKTLKI